MADSTQRNPYSSPALNSPGQPEEAAVLWKVTIRLIPFLFLLYIINILDRTNVGIAKVPMSDDLNMGNAAFGLGAGLFYVGYVLFEVPSNLIMARTGARVWIARILISWGLVTAATMFVVGPKSFFAMRILLGVAEAGFFPGIILYLSQWFPTEARARAVAKFMMASLIASMLGNPISGAILQFMNEIGGLKGWQWLFLLEGIPAIALGFVTYRYLTDRPELADWLTPTERKWLIDRLATEQQVLHGGKQGSFRAALVDPRVWLLIGVYFTVAVGDNCFGFFMPTLINKFFPEYHNQQLKIGLLAAIPAVVAMVAMIANAMHSDRTGERRGHVAGAAFAAACGWVLLAFAPSPWLAIAALALTSAGMKSMLPTFWALPTTMLSGAAAAGGIALINSVANIGGFLGPFAFGALGEKYESFTLAMLIVAAILAGGAVLVLFAPRGASKSE